MEVTKREIITSISIISIMLIIGVLISGKISDSIADNNSVYNKALKIEDKEIFEYGMKTNIGNAFVYGEMEAIDSVSFPEIEGEYLYIKKVKEEYTMHTRVVTRTNSKGQTYTTTETYWSWDRVGSEEKKSKNVKFLGVEFKFNQFKNPYESYISTIKESSSVRYKYYGVPKKIKGTIFTELKNGDIGKENVIYKNNIEETYEILTNDSTLIFFWIVWIILICASVYGFCYLENNWLE